MENLGKPDRTGAPFSPDNANGQDGLDRLCALISAGRRVVFFGGAGVSTESGIPDFRGAGGLYGRAHACPPEKMLSHSFFKAQPEAFFDFYRANLLYLKAVPGKAHRALARLEALGGLSAVITQNIDGLHQAAGSVNVLELHGSVHRNTCLSCGARYPARAVACARGVPRCDCGGVIKPDVVLYEEALDDTVVRRAIAAIRACDVLLIGGTSLTVYPAAGLIGYCRGRVAVINREETPADAQADVCVRGGVGDALACCQSACERAWAAR